MRVEPKPAAIVRSHEDADALAEAIKAEYEVIAKYGTLVAKYGRKSLVRARKTGDLLWKAKEQLPHGVFADWFQAQGFNFTQQTGSGYMRIADQWEEVRAAGSIKEALMLLGQTTGSRSLPDRLEREQKRLASWTKEEWIKMVKYLQGLIRRREEGPTD